MQRKSRYLVWVVIVTAAITLLLSWSYWDYRLANRTLPARMTIAGLQVGGMTRAQALNALEVAFSTPLSVTYVDRKLSLSPHAVELQYDADQTARNLDAVLADRWDLEGFVAHVLRQEHGRLHVPVAVTYSEQGLSRFLDRVVDSYDGPPQEPVALPATLDFRPGRPGTWLDADASRERLASALISAADRDVTLVVDVEKASPKDITLLRQLLQSRLSDHPDLVPGIYIKGMQTGEELSINGEVAYAGLGVLEIAALEEVYRSLDEPPDAETSKFISETMTESGNFTANLLLRDVIGEGDSHRAVQVVTASMNRLGLADTYMAAAYDEREAGSDVVTPTNSSAAISTEPDLSIQTTPLNVGMLLEMIYQCRSGGGTLVMTYPDSVTAGECQQMIRWLGRNRIDSLIEAGVPAEARVAHQHGWTSDTHADAGIVFSPGGDFVLVIFIHSSQWLEWDVSASLIAEISTAAYRYFNTSW